MPCVIFDMDGVLADTEILQAKVKSKILKEFFSVDLRPVALTTRYAGMMEKVMFEKVIAELGLSYSESRINDAVEEKWTRTYEILSHEPPKPIEGALELLDHLHERNVVMGLASGAPLHFIEFITKALGIWDKFRAITSSEEVTLGKPAPDVFLLCGRRLGVDPKECIVIEDSRSGMLAARQAGMLCIGLVEDRAQHYPTDVKVTSLCELIPFATTPIELISSLP